MCQYCTMDNRIIKAIEAWVDNSFSYTKMAVLKRPSAETHPNTFVFFLENALPVDGKLCTLKIDVHYKGHSITGGQDRIAIGGLWITGVKGAMKPQQHGGQLLRSLNNELPGRSPAISDGTYGVR